MNSWQSTFRYRLERLGLVLGRAQSEKRTAPPVQRFVAASVTDTLDEQLRAKFANAVLVNVRPRESCKVELLQALAGVRRAFAHEVRAFDEAVTELERQGLVLLTTDDRDTLIYRY